MLRRQSPQAALQHSMQLAAFLGGVRGTTSALDRRALGAWPPMGDAAASFCTTQQPAGLCSSSALSALRRYYLDARQAQPPVEAEKAAAEKEEAHEVRVPQPVDAEALLREAEEQAGDQVSLQLIGC